MADLNRLSVNHVLGHLLLLILREEVKFLNLIGVVRNP